MGSDLTRRGPLLLPVNDWDPMNSSKSKRPAHSSAADTTPAVDAFMAALDHPFKDLVQAIRETILAVDPAIAEGVKWNAPSYRTSEYFATTNLREKKGVGVILHLGAKVKDVGEQRVVVDDPDEILKWLARDRAQVVFTSLDDFSCKRTNFKRLVLSWVANVST